MSHCLRYSHAKDYAASIAVDLLTEFATASSLGKRAATALRPLGVGNLIYKSALGQTITLAISAAQVAASQPEFVEAASLDATNAVPVRAYWS